VQEVAERRKLRLKMNQSNLMEFEKEVYNMKETNLLISELYVLATAELDEAIKEELETKDPEPQAAEAAINEATQGS
jgi:hypothetical protein